VAAQLDEIDVLVAKLLDGQAAQVLVAQFQDAKPARSPRTP